MNEQADNSGQLPQAEAGSGGDSLDARAVYALATSWRRQASSQKSGRSTLIRCAEELEAALAARQPVGVEPIGTLKIWHFRGLPSMENTDFDYTGSLPPGSYAIYAAPPAPAAVPVDAKLIWWLSDAIGILSASGNTFHAEELQKLHDMLATHPQPAAAVPSTGVQAIAEERARQVQVEGMTPEGDAGYRHGQLAWAAVAYMQLASMELRDGGRAHIATASPPACWPWDASWWKPRDVRRDLVRAGALIAAQVDALDSQGKANG